MTTASDKFGNVNVNVNESGQSTYVKFINFKYKWTIHNFKVLVEILNIKSLESEKFPKENTYGFEGQLSIQRHNNRVWPVKLSARYKETRVNCKLSILNYKGQEIRVKKFRLSIENDKKSEFIADSLIDGAIIDYVHEADDLLTILCEVTIASEKQDILTQFNIPECRWREDFSSYFKSKSLSDVTLCCGNNNEFAAHKVILSARSPVFYKMIKEKMAPEENGNNCEITNLNPEVLNEMLSYIYTGKVSNLKNTAKDLLAAAEMFELDDTLKALCKEELSQTNSTENSADLPKSNVIQLSKAEHSLFMESLKQNSTNNLFYK